MINAKDIRDKTYSELSAEEITCLKSIADKLSLVTSERNIVWMALMFNNTVFESLSKVRGK